MKIWHAHCKIKQITGTLEMLVKAETANILEPQDETVNDRPSLKYDFIESIKF